LLNLTALFNLWFGALIRLLTKFLEYACVISAGLLFLSTFAEVVLRYVLKTLPGWVGSELPPFVLIWTGAFGIPLAVERGVHLSVDILPRYLKGKAQLSAMVGLLTNLAGIIFFIILLNGAWKFSVDNFSSNSPMIGVSMFWINVSLVVCSIFSLFFAVQGIILGLGNLVSPSISKPNIDTKGVQ